MEKNRDLQVNIKNPKLRKAYLDYKKYEFKVLKLNEENFIDFCKTWIKYGKGTQLAIYKSKRIIND